MIKNKLVFSIVNDEQKHISIKMTMNDKDPVWEQEFFTAEDNVAAEFDYNYTEPYNWLTIYFTGDEQRNKLFAIKSVSINNQKLQVNSGFYTVYPNDFWNNLSDSDSEQMRHKVLAHGGMLGWFGEINFEFFDLKHKRQMGKYHPTRFGVNRIVL